MTIHKSQGASFDKLRICLGKGNMESTFGLTYVALTRVARFEDLCIDCFSNERLGEVSAGIIRIIERIEKFFEEIRKRTKKDKGTLSLNQIFATLHLKKN